MIARCYLHWVAPTLCTMEAAARSAPFGVVISNLSSAATEEDIRESFSFCGAFVSLSLSACVR